MKNIPLLKSLLISLLICLLVIISGCTYQVDNMEKEIISVEDSSDNDFDSGSTIDNKQISDSVSSGYSLDEIAEHDSIDDCWLLIDDKVYDVTDFIGNHPGGNSILEGCGKDATDLFETRPMGSGTPHSSGARIRLDNYYIGEYME